MRIARTLAVLAAAAYAVRQRQRLSDLEARLARASSECAAAMEQHRATPHAAYLMQQPLLDEQQLSTAFESFVAPSDGLNAYGSLGGSPKLDLLLRDGLSRPVPPPRLVDPS